MKNDENETGCALATVAIVEPEAFMRGVFLRKGRKPGGWPVPVDKDPGDALQKDLNVRGQAGLLNRKEGG